MDNNVSAVLMPEIVIYNTLKSIFKIVKDDFNSASSESETILHNFFGIDENNNKLSWETFDYFEQAKELFIQRDIEVNLGYNMENSGLGCVHILLPEETGRDFGIGADENYQPNVVTPISPGVDNYTPQYNKMFDASYNLMITSENTLEVLLIYNFIKASFIALHYHLELSGLRLPKFAGRDVQIQSDLVPSHVFHRSFNLSFFYEVYVPDFFSKRIIREFAVTGIIQSNENE
jgi:hypothetical protein